MKGEKFAKKPWNFPPITGINASINLYKILGSDKKDNNKNDQTDKEEEHGNTCKEESTKKKRWMK